MSFPLEEGQYFGVPSEDGLVVSRGRWIPQILEAVRSPAPGSRFDTTAEAAVMTWQGEHELPVTGRVTEQDWAVMFPEEG